MSGGSRVQVTGSRDLQRLARDLRSAHGPQVVRDLKKELRTAAKPIIPVIRANIRAIPSQGVNRRRGNKPLRSRLSRAVTLQVKVSSRRASISIFMNPRKMPDGMKSLPGYMEGARKYERWKHKVYPVPSRPAVWVQQESHPYIDSAVVQRAEFYARRAVDAVAERIAEQLENE